MLRRLIREVRAECEYDEWHVGVIPRGITEVGELQELSDVRWLPNQHAFTYCADPFLHEIGPHRFILAEQYDYRRGGRGRIVRISLEDPTEPVRPILSIPWHASYPCTVTTDSGVYVVPEVYRAGECRAFRVSADGALWPGPVLVAGLAAVDPTVFWWEGRWWLFCTDHGRDPLGELFAFHALRFEGPWLPHEGNPLKADRGSARPAGKPFGLGGRLYRPAQDCSRVYGGAVVVQEITHLTPHSFSERPVLRLEPDPSWPYPDGLHHLDVGASCVLIDAKRHHRDWLFWLKRNVVAASGSKRR